MVKLKITRSDGTVIEAEGAVDDLVKLAPQIVPWVAVPVQPYIQDHCGGNVGPWGYTVEIVNPPPHAAGQHLTGCPLGCPH